MALVSVVIAVYNTEKHLGECLDSVLAQTEGNIEVVCVDDGSTDNSGALLDDYAARDARVRVLHQTNQGVSAARNAGMAAATGDWIMFADSDDYLANNACEKALAVAQATAADIVVFGGSLFPSDPYFDALLKPRNTIIDNGVEALLNEAGSIPFTWNKLYRRSLLESCGAHFDETLPLGEDNVFQFAVFPHAQRIAFCQDELYFYRFHRQDSAVRNLWNNMGDKLNLHLDVIERVFARWEEKRLLKAHRVQLATWMVDFLWPDVARAGFDARCALADRLKALVARYALAAEKLDSVHKRRLRFMLDARGGLGGKPTLSLVVFAEPGTADIAEQFVRLSCQSEQRLQILCIRANASEDEYNELLRAAAGDARASAIDATGEQEIRAALQAAQAPYVLFCSVNDSFEQSLIEDLNWALSRQAADICTFFDHYHILGIGDVGRMLVARETTGVAHQPSTTGVVPPYPASEAQERLYEYASLSFRNKAFSTEFLRAQNLQSLDEASIARVLEQAENIVPLGQHLMQVTPLLDATEEHATAAANTLAQTFGDLADRLQADGLWDTREGAWAQALATAACSHSYQYLGNAAAAYADALREQLAALLPEETYPSQNFRGKAATFVDDLRTLPADQFVARNTMRRIAYLQHYCKHLEEQRNQLTQEQTHLEERLAIADSPSARVGRALGTPFRVARRLLGN